MSIRATLPALHERERRRMCRRAEELPTAARVWSSRQWQGWDAGESIRVSNWVSLLRTPRFHVLLGVLLAHAILIGVISRASLIRLPTSNAPLLLSVPRQITRQPWVPVVHLDLQAINIGVVPPPKSTNSATATTSDLPQVDWAGEAHRQAEQAAAALNVPAPRSFAGLKPLTSLKDDLPAPPHHAGEQEMSGDGKLMVWISPNCYQTSDLVRLPGLAGQNTMAKTYCKSKSGTPDGDLFKDLDAYKKYGSK